MGKARLALAGGFNGNGGDDGGPKSPLEQLTERMIARGRTGNVHPIFALHYHEDYFTGFLSIDLRVEACKKIILETRPESLQNKRVAGLMMVMEDHPEGYLAKALYDLGINDFREWLKPRTMNHDVVRPEFGTPR